MLSDAVDSTDPLRNDGSADCLRGRTGGVFLDGSGGVGFAPFWLVLAGTDPERPTLFSSSSGSFPIPDRSSTEPCPLLGGLFTVLLAIGAGRAGRGRGCTAGTGCAGDGTESLAWLNLAIRSLKESTGGSSVSAIVIAVDPTCPVDWTLKTEDKEMEWM